MSLPVEKLFAGEPVPIFMGDRRTVVYEEVSKGEAKAITKVFKYGLEQLAKISPKIASSIEPQLSIALKVAGIFKEMLPEKKSYAFPSETGSLGVAWLWPGAIRYVATPSATAPAYTSYPANSWDLDLTAGTPVYFFGDGTNFYKASPQTAKHSMLLIFKDGIIELGSTPKLATFQLTAEGLTKYGIYSVAPIVEERIEGDRNIYQYPTPMGAITVFYDKGVMFGAMPLKTGTSTIKLLGLVFYEHDLYPDLSSTWIA